jgi:endo-1,4-beta-D-glucanase Y
MNQNLEQPECVSASKSKKLSKSKQNRQKTRESRKRNKHELEILESYYRYVLPISSPSLDLN